MEIANNFGNNVSVTNDNSKKRSSTVILKRKGTADQILGKDNVINKSQFKSEIYDFSKDLKDSVNNNFSDLAKESKVTTVEVPLTSIDKEKLSVNEKNEYEKKIEKVNESAMKKTLDDKNINKEDVQNLTGEKKKDFDKALQENTENIAQKEKMKMKLGERSDITIGNKKGLKEYIADDNTKWLGKKAVNCLGIYKPAKPLISDVGKSIQNLVDPDTAVDVFTGKTAEGEENITFQREITGKVVDKETLDLEKFSKNPDKATPEELKKVEELGNQILREHVTDWLMCNFDTSGNNFVVTTDESNNMVLHGVNKENSFEKILATDAQNMSPKSKPNSDTLYKAVFDKYAKGEINLNIDFMKDKVKEIVEMDNGKYMEQFSDYLNHVREKDPSKYAQTYQNILARKNNLGRDYNNMFTDLINERIKNTEEKNPKEAERLKNTYLNNRDKKLNAFKEKNYTALDYARSRLTKFREEGYSKIGRFGKNGDGVRMMLAAAQLGNQINQIEAEKTMSRKEKDNKIRELTSPKNIQKYANSLKNDERVKALVEAVSNKEVKPSDFKNSKEFIKGMISKHKELAAQRAIKRKEELQKAAEKKRKEEEKKKEKENKKEKEKEKKEEKEKSKDKKGAIKAA